METSCPMSDMSQIAPIVGVVVAIVIAIVVLIAVAIMVLICCMVFRKAGYHWALGLLILVPIANIVMPFVLAFGNWPVLKELRQLKGQQVGPSTPA